MSKSDYFVQLHDATSAGEIHQLRQLATVDGDLTSADLAQVNAAIGKKFAALNHKAVGKQPPRWATGVAATSPHLVRIPTSNRCH